MRAAQASRIVQPCEIAWDAARTKSQSVREFRLRICASLRTRSTRHEDCPLGAIQVRIRFSDTTNAG